MSKYYCLYCKHYKPIQCGSEGTEPEGICYNPHTAIDYVYGHDYCEQYDEIKDFSSMTKNDIVYAVVGKVFEYSKKGEL